ncbi:hypothetical protein LHYA1_G005234 [Lachnellula hyalina]|uniref:Glycoprotease family protein n=1 Tax=Lachnellula hyalina TaxID=1316788 RepID=A0A8H8R006_9HELO|nr:uncharacterized protein LHYA1_G005234 [Lachnellula hyalina]TVY25908.1 hypothetical protein LHYA1_G005234 [Lachnellula hyalina]
MATTRGTQAIPSTSKDIPSTKSISNPFNTVFDGEESGDESWDEEDSSSDSDKHLERITQWPRPPDSAVGGVSTVAANRTNTRKPDKRYSVHKPTRDKSRGRQKKQNAKAGIKLVTTFTRHQDASPPVQVQPSKTMPQRGYFVDLAALQALNGESTQSQASGKFWKSKSKKTKGLGLIRAPDTVPSIPAVPSGVAVSGATYATNASQKVPSTLTASPLKLSDDLSPNDRPIMIGLSIPSSDVSQQSLSPQTASSDISNIVRSYDRTHHTPDTPTIIITPAQEVSDWSPLKPRPHPASSIYSQAVNSEEVYTSQNAPPIPKVPDSVLKKEQQRVAAQTSYFSPDSDNGTSWEDDEYTSDHCRSRVVSTCTVFEEDESPIIARTARAVSVTGANNAARHASVSTVATRRRSKGWWNYITTPFLTRSNTFATRSPEDQHPPAVPDLAIAAAKAQDAGREGKSWEKQFSPLTPETSTTIQSDPWWNVDSKDTRPIGQSPVLQETRHKVQASTGTLPIVLSEVAGFEAASTMSSIASSDLSRFNSSRSTNEISNDRAVPVLSDAPNSRGLQSNNPYVQPQIGDVNDISGTSHSGSLPVIQHAQIAVLQRAQLPVQRTQSPSTTPPPPPYSPSPSRNPRYRAVFPPGHVRTLQQPASPGPISPGMQQAMASPGAIQMTTAPLAHPSRRPINLNSSYPAELPPRQNVLLVTTEHVQGTSKKSNKSEAKRRRHEKEDAVAHKAGGWWRGRGCIPKRGCYGRGGAEGRKKRRCTLGLVIGLLAMLILIVALATTLSRKPNTIIGPSQWVNLTGFPPMFTGLSTVVAPTNTVTNTGCVFPATQWSCSLPKEVQSSIAPNQANQPNFLLYVQWDNSSSANDTFKNVTGNPTLGARAVGGNAVSAGQLIKSVLLKARDIVTFVPSPAPPSFADDFFLGNTTDNIASSNKAGEPTPFFISFLPSSNSTTSKRSLMERQSPDNSSDMFPNISSIIPAPSLNSDNTAAPANLFPLPTQQPIRLYDRGLPTEHYGFYTYFDRSIFLKSLDLDNSSNTDSGAVPDDENGGARESEASFRCTWTQTRFLVQMWTRMNTTARLLNSTHTISKDPAHDLSQPGSFPYPITITTDRHGGDADTKMLYCYSMDDREGIEKGSGIILKEQRGFGGTLINPANLLFGASGPSDPSLGGFDGGTGGCGCQWQNWQGVVGG